MVLYLSDKSQYLNLGAILLKDLGGGASVYCGHISSVYTMYIFQLIQWKQLSFGNEI